jgi:hypothetical protein
MCQSESGNVIQSIEIGIRISGLFIESEKLGGSDFVATFTPYCAGVIEEKMKCAGA